MSDPSESIIEEEVGALEAIYIHELDVKRNDKNEVSDMVLQLHPATGANTNQQYVCMTLLLGIPTEYPYEPPNIEIKNPRGIGEEEVQSTLEAMLALSIERKGEAVLYELIELAKECLTEGNLPRCACMICLEHFIEGDNFQKTSCYHYFHDVCLGRYVKHALSEKTEVVLAHVKKEAKKLVCPVCREEISYSEESFPATPVEEKMIYYPSAVMRKQQAEMAAVLEKQRQSGGLIDLEAEKNKYLVTAEDVVYLNISRSSNNSPNPSSDNLEPLETERVNGAKGNYGHDRVGSGLITNNGHGSRLKGQPHSDGKLRGNVRQGKDRNMRHYDDERNWEYSEFDGYADYDEPRTSYRGSYGRDSAMYKSENRNVESRTRYRNNYDRDSARHKNDIHRVERPRDSGKRDRSDQNNSGKQIHIDKVIKEISNDTGAKDHVDTKTPTKTRTVHDDKSIDTGAKDHVDSKTPTTTRTVHDDKRNRFRNDNSYNGERFDHRSGKRFNDKPDNSRFVKDKADNSRFVKDKPDNSRFVKDKPDNSRSSRELENFNSDKESHADKALDIKLTKDGTEVRRETHNGDDKKGPITEHLCDDRHEKENVTKRKLDGPDRHHSNYDRKDDHRRMADDRKRSDRPQSGEAGRIDRHDGTNKNERKRDGSDSQPSYYDRKDDHRRVSDERRGFNYDRKDDGRRVSDERRGFNYDRKDDNRRVSDERQRLNFDRKDDNRRMSDDTRRSDHPQYSGGRGRRPYRDDKDNRYGDNNLRNNREFKSKQFSAGASKLVSSDTGTDRKGFGKPSVKTDLDKSNHFNSAEITSNSNDNDKRKDGYSKSESDTNTGYKRIENAKKQRDDKEQLFDNPKRNNVTISNDKKTQNGESRSAFRGRGRGRGFNRNKNIDEMAVPNKCDYEKLRQVDTVDRLNGSHIENKNTTGSDKRSDSSINMSDTSVKQGLRPSGPPGFSVKPPPGF